MVEQTVEQQYQQHFQDLNPLLDVPGIKSDILESFREESPLGYELFCRVVECNDLRGSPDRVRQLMIILHFPKKFRERLEQHLVASRHREEYFRKRRGERSVRNAIMDTFSKEKGIYAGELFEELVRSENKMAELSRGEAKTVLIEKLKIARELMNVWQYPEKFGINTHWRNPDAAFFEIDNDGTIILKAVGEAKAGKLDTRAYQQLQENGIQRQLDSLLQYLKQKDEGWFRKKKLPTLAERINKIDVAKDFKIRLFIPRNDFITNEAPSEDDLRKLIKNPYDDMEFADEFVHLLSNKDRISIYTSAFSSKELAAMTTFLYGYADA